jgi:hypothetical protein
VYILDEAGEGKWPMGGAGRWWLHHALAALDASLRQRGSRLLIAHGNAGEVLGDLVKATGAGAVFWNRRYEPAVIARDAAIKAALTAGGVEAKSFCGALLFEPHTIQNKQGKPFQVFTPYWKHCLTLPVPVVVKFGAERIAAPLLRERSVAHVSPKCSASARTHATRCSRQLPASSGASCCVSRESRDERGRWPDGSSDETSASTRWKARSCRLRARLSATSAAPVVASCALICVAAALASAVEGSGAVPTRSTR